MIRKQEDSLTRVIQDADTDAINVPVGGRVRCIMAELKGVEGVMVATRTLGRVLIRIADGVFIEVPRICVQRVGDRNRPKSR